MNTFFNIILVFFLKLSFFDTKINQSPYVVSTINDTTTVKSFKLPNNTFESGKYNNFDRSRVDSVISQIQVFLNKVPINQKVIIEIESSESTVPTQSLGLPHGKLSELRAIEMKKYIQSLFNRNIEIKERILGVQGPAWDKTKGKDHNDYKRWQYVTFNIIVSGKNIEKICSSGFYLVVDYNKEWCDKNGDQTLCHKCDFALFFVWANGIPLTDMNGSRYIDLNNFTSDLKLSGPSKKVKIIVDSLTLSEILSKDSSSILITYNCAIPECHSEPIHITIYDLNNKIILPGTFFTNNGKKLSRKTKPVNLIKLDRCGNVLEIYKDTLKPKENKIQEKQTVAFNLEIDKYNNYTPESIYGLYKLVDSTGVLKIPQDQLKVYRLYKKYNNYSWGEIVIYLGLSKKEINNFNKFLEKNKKTIQ